MEKLIDKFERAIGKSVRDLTEDSFAEILNNEDYQGFFKNPDEFLELLSTIKKLTKDEVVKSRINTLIYNIEIVRAEATVDSIFNSYSNEEITREELEEKVITLIDSSETITSLVAISCALLSLENLDLSVKLEKISKTISDMKNVLDDLKGLEYNYSAKCSLIDFIYQIREDYFTQYDVDLLKDIDWLNDELKEIHDFEDKFILKDKLQTSVNVTPEELGYIDITKLKENKGGE